jgi:hypothetical protein
MRINVSVSDPYKKSILTLKIERLQKPNNLKVFGAIKPNRPKQDSQILPRSHMHEEGEP